MDIEKRVTNQNIIPVYCNDIRHGNQETKTTKSTQLHLPAIARQVEDLKNRVFSNLIQGRFKIEQGDITHQKSDAIVHAANTSLVLGSGVAGTIRQNGGQAVIDKFNKITHNGNKPLELGKVATTSGGRRDSNIIHAAVMPWGGSATFDSIRKATRNIIVEARHKGFKTLSIPALGAGAGGL